MQSCDSASSAERCLFWWEYWKRGAIAEMASPIFEELLATFSLVSNQRTYFEEMLNGGRHAVIGDC